MPDITTWSKRDVHQLVNLLNIELSESGSGYVKEQSIAEGEKITENSKLKVTFEEPITK
mgnify:CR=1 FL=1